MAVVVGVGGEKINAELTLVLLFPPPCSDIFLGLINDDKLNPEVGVLGVVGEPMRKGRVCLIGESAENRAPFAFASPTGLFEDVVLQGFKSEVQDDVWIVDLPCVFSFPPSRILNPRGGGVDVDTVPFPFSLYSS